MDAQPKPTRVALVVHPTRPIAEALAVLERWAEQAGLEVVEIPSLGGVDRHVARLAAPEPGDLIIALGGDGTVLSALRASAPIGAPVLGTACGSLGALTAVSEITLPDALARVSAGDWTARRLPALAIDTDDGPTTWAVNDFVAVRHGAGQLVASVSVDDELYVRLAGDGVIVASAVGSSAYSMAAGGPIVVAGTPVFVFTPLAMHGGSAPPLVVPATSTLHVELHPGFAGFDVEIDGHTYPGPALDYRITVHDSKVTLVTFDPSTLGLTGLRQRQLIIDSPRVLARDARAIPPPRADPAAS
jgi:NAD+ kinase